MIFWPCQFCIILTFLATLEGSLKMHFKGKVASKTRFVFAGLGGWGVMTIKYFARTKNDWIIENKKKFKAKMILGKVLKWFNQNHWRHFSFRSVVISVVYISLELKVNLFVIFCYFYLVCLFFYLFRRNYFYGVWNMFYIKVWYILNLFCYIWII